MEITDYIPLIDLTRLGDNNTADEIATLCHAAQTPYGNVAAVCVHPHSVSLAAQLLSQTSINIATVANFPHGIGSLKDTQRCIDQCLSDGADEIDVVLPYDLFLNGQRQAVTHFVEGCRQQTLTKCLKVILETGSYASTEQITEVALLSIDCGADFIKTSTGKIALGATPKAASAMLAAIQQRPNRTVGIKLSGGIRDLHAASMYYQLAQDAMGPQWIQAKTFRLGASGLLNTILKTLPSSPMTEK